MEPRQPPQTFYALIAHCGTKRISLRLIPEFLIGAQKIIFCWWFVGIPDDSPSMKVLLDFWWLFWDLVHFVADFWGSFEILRDLYWDFWDVYIGDFCLVSVFYFSPPISFNCLNNLPPPTLSNVARLECQSRIVSGEDEHGHADCELQRLIESLGGLVNHPAIFGWDVQPRKNPLWQTGKIIRFE